ncbi:hypothetical protein M6B38_319030 [Iris pallida]|uniref:Uncharacterized protein n=1 Tax=Iris pallida TaxID=29817 RepID=A0AAX6E9A0_IRIPA|nr:hypothetical protein M6B38_201135 [Iris pallida]KAJ6838755.1 hypothetical protein M6B38_319030 [Iris pallida]
MHGLTWTNITLSCGSHLISSYIILYNEPSKWLKSEPFTLLLYHGQFYLKIIIYVKNC